MAPFLAAFLPLLGKTVEKVVDKVLPDPEKAAAAKAELAKIDLEKMVLEQEETKAFLADTASARDRETKVSTSAEAPLINKVIVPCLAIGILTLSFGLFGILLFVKVDPAHKDILIYVLGVLSALCTQVCAYYFGSSAGSTAKDQTLKRVLSNTPQ